jgi:hypothetical protein
MCNNVEDIDDVTDHHGRTSDDFDTDCGDYDLAVADYRERASLDAAECASDCACRTSRVIGDWRDDDTLDGGEYR